MRPDRGIPGTRIRIAAFIVMNCALREVKYDSIQRSFVRIAVIGAILSKCFVEHKLVRPMETGDSKPDTVGDLP